MAKLTIEVPDSIVEGGSVLLLVTLNHGIVGPFASTKDLIAKQMITVHYKIATDSSKWGYQSNGRKTIYTDGSLLLFSVTQRIQDATA